VDSHHYFGIGWVMASLKSFLHGMAPILGITGAALYERQRALTTLGILEAVPGRGPGSGVSLTAEGVAAVIISVLAAENLSEVDKRVVDLCGAIPGVALTKGGTARKEWERLGKPTFLSEVGLVLSGKNTVWRPYESPRRYTTIRVTRPSIGQISSSPTGADPIIYHPNSRDSLMSSQRPIRITASVEYDTLERLIDFTTGALSVAEQAEDEQ